MAGGNSGQTSGRDQRASFGRDFAATERAAFAPHAAFQARRLLPYVTITTDAGARTYAIHPALWLGGALLAATLALTSMGAALYAAMHDDILEIAIARPIRMEQAYEDRIAALRSEIDRINSRQLIDQDAFEAKISELMTRQDALRADEARVAGLLTKASDQNIHISNGANLGGNGQLGGDLTGTTPVTSSAPPTPTYAPTPPPRPIETTPLRASWLFGFGRPGDAVRRTGRPQPGVQIAGIETEINRMKAAELSSIAAVAGLAETNAQTIERVVGRLGLRMPEADPIPAPKPKPQDVASRNAPTSQPGVGGPLVPILAEGDILTRAEAALGRLNMLKEGVSLLPVRTPLTTALEITSPFGERPDPFLGVWALHTGADLRANLGDPVEATAAGVVTEASRQGGYGNMVEIDHGNGLVTRYGHLSQISAFVGQKVKAGHVIGYVGSTGRSTAPHLHYETRVNGVAVNPEAYLHAGNQLRPLLN